MSLCWNNRIIADVSLARIHGFKVAGGFGFRLGLVFSVPAWDEKTAGPMPTVLFYPAQFKSARVNPTLLRVRSRRTPNRSGSPRSGQARAASCSISCSHLRRWSIWSGRGWVAE